MKTKLQTYWSYFQKISPLIAVVFVVLWLRSCDQKNQEADRYENNLEAKASEIKNYKLKNGQLATEKQLLEVSEKELKDQIWVKDDSIQSLLKKIDDPKVVIKWRTKIVFDTIFLPFSEPVPYEFNRTFKKENPWYTISGKVNQSGVTIDPPLFQNTQRLAVGFSKGKPTVTVTNSNPHIVTNEIEGQIIDIPNKPWVIGAGAIWNIYEVPSVGIFIGRTILRF